MNVNLSRLAALLLLGFSAVLLPNCAFTGHQLPMQRDDFGLNFVPVRVNGHSGVFLVDSGASHTVLDHRFAKQCVRKMVASDLRLAWLGSEDTLAKEGVIDEIQIGNYRRQGPFRAHILNLDAINEAPARKRTIRMDGIVGADFFITHGALIDYRSNALRFQPGGEGWMERLSPRPLPVYQRRR